jgi:hypothetical protein
MPSHAQAEPIPRAAVPEPPSRASRQATGPRQQEGLLAAVGKIFWLAPGHVSVFSARAYLKAAARPLQLPHLSLAQKFPSLGCLLALSPLTSKAPQSPPSPSSLPSQRSPAGRPWQGKPRSCSGFRLLGLTFLSAPGLSLFPIFLGLFSASKSRGDWGFGWFFFGRSRGALRLITRGGLRCVPWF